MNINRFNNPIDYRINCKSHSDYAKISNKDKAVILSTTALGIGVAASILAKRAGYSLNPNKMFKNIKNSYLANVEYHAKEVISVGAGSVLGGLAGGLMISDNKHDKKAKMREALLQMGNIAIPIKIVDFVSEKCVKFGKTAQALGSIAALLVGVMFANIVMNKVNDLIFKNKEGRGVKLTDFSAHLDDTIVAASYISKADFVKAVARIIPVALGCAGYEVGIKTANKKEA